MNIFNNLKSVLKDIDGVTYINGIKIEGAQSITIDNGKVYVNGNLQEDLSTPSIEIKVEGSVGSINTTSGDVTCGDIAGSVNTMSGDIYKK